jgi:AcrR family transcriptional regulator
MSAATQPTATQPTATQPTATQSTATQPTARAAGRRRDPRSDAALIEAVLDLVSKGATLSGLSLVTIAAHAGVSRNSLYRRWKTKEALYLDVLSAINRPLPEPSGGTAKHDLTGLLRVLTERVIDRRASQMLRALNAEAGAFPDLHRRYFDEVVGPRRDAMLKAIQRGIDRGEIRPDVDVEFASGLLVAPLLAAMSRGDVDLDPARVSENITDLVFAGLTPR